MNSQLTINPNSLIGRAKEIQWSKLDDEMLAIDSQAGNCYSLNETAGKVWELIQTPISLRDLCKQLSEAYKVDEATCLNDTVELLTALHDARLVSIDNA